jgi:hypothetical protein
MGCVDAHRVEEPVGKSFVGLLAGVNEDGLDVRMEP